ncbi:hypothetical protein BDN72DRAFT_906519 [Pluteus cervinus]|uniref:Uncharacterized protein n=1 Tax=Pluteus cervinus TaxID=181527 RepID=A0ACD3A1A1_9AGAR|nr:hypothetical protein BDN72DRAFT_906519 [Pluteus cervinus]
MSMNTEISFRTDSLEWAKDEFVEAYLAYAFDAHNTNQTAQFLGLIEPLWLDRFPLKLSSKEEQNIQRLKDEKESIEGRFFWARLTAKLRRKQMELPSSWSALTLIRDQGERRFHWKFMANLGVIISGPQYDSVISPAMRAETITYLEARRERMSREERAREAARAREILRRQESWEEFMLGCQEL